MIYLYILIALLVVGRIAREVQWHLERKEWAVERGEWVKERADLLQRIQAPQSAVMLHENLTAGPLPLHVPFDDDEEFQKSKDELAEQGWKEELSGSR